MTRAILGWVGCVAMALAFGACIRKKAPPSPSPPAGSASVSAGETPSGYVVAHVAGVTHLPSGGDVVLLVESGKKRAIPIFIGGTEALSIQLRVEKKTYKRPLTHDLLDTSVSKLGGRIESVRVDKIVDGIFYGTVVLVNGQSRFELDARPSDAIALALGNEAPIQVAASVFERAGVELDRAPDEIQRRAEPHPGQPEPVSL